MSRCAVAETYALVQQALQDRWQDAHDDGDHLTASLHADTLRLVDAAWASRTPHLHRELTHLLNRTLTTTRDTTADPAKFF